MNAEGKLFEAVYNTELGRIDHYLSWLTVDVNGKVYAHDFVTSVELFEQLKKNKPEDRAQYVTWIESYLRRMVGAKALEGVDFKYA